MIENMFINQHIYLIFEILGKEHSNLSYKNGKTKSPLLCSIILTKLIGLKKALEKCKLSSFLYFKPKQVNKYYLIWMLIISKM